MRLSLPWFLPMLLLLAPWLLLAGVGVSWLWQNSALLPWLVLAFALNVAAWIAGMALKNKRISPFKKLPCFEPDRIWPPTAEAAWGKVKIMADKLEPSEYPLGNPDRLLRLAHRIIKLVAGELHPASKRAELKVSLPSVLLIAERASRDMRELLEKQVPASHLITIEDGLMLWRWKEKQPARSANERLPNLPRRYWRKFRLRLIDPFAAYPMGELERWLLQTLARKIGYYAILLYSGQQKVADLKPGTDSARDVEIATRKDMRDEEPLRILIAGQTNAGKSSLINALFGELQAITDALPATYTLTPYALEKDGEFLGLAFDSPGYGDRASWVEDRRSELLQFDLVLLACSATHAGRSADERFLQALRTRYAEMPDRIMPPFLVAVTHIDLLRPMREWNPPYNLLEPAGAKESQIRACLEEISNSLNIPLELVQAVCLKPSDEWNIEAVWTTIAAQLPEARKARYLRCLKDERAREKWDLILRQLGNAGRLAATGIGKLWTGK